MPWRVLTAGGALYVDLWITVSKLFTNLQEALPALGPGFTQQGTRQPTQVEKDHIVQTGLRTLPVHDDSGWTHALQGLASLFPTQLPGPQALDPQLSPALQVTRPSPDTHWTLPGFEDPPSCSSNLTTVPDLLPASLFWGWRD